MIPLSKAQRDQLIAIAVVTAAMMGALWHFGVQAKQSQLADTEKKTQQVKDKLKSAKTTLESSDTISTQLRARSDLLAKREAILAPERDAYAWIINNFNNFIQSRSGVNIYSYSQPDISDTGILQGFPYKWATFHIKGSGYYYEFGRFFADLENAFPFYRVKSVDITVGASTAGGDPEKLNYSFDLAMPMLSSETK